MGSQTIPQIPKIDFTGVDLKNPGSAGWGAVRSQVFQALDSLGCFEAVYDGAPSTELRAHLFGVAFQELFSLPLETKRRNLSPKNFEGYVGQVPGWAFESLGIDNPQLLEGTQGFTDLMWPEGNPSFCNTVWTFAKQLRELELTVRQMVLESLGIEKHLDSFIESTYCSVRFMEYGVPLDQETNSGMRAHTDMSVLTILCQDRVHGLEVQNRDGEWIRVVPSPNSFTVMIGEAFEAWTNGRLKPPYHRVDVTSKEKRFSVGYGVSPKDGYLVQAPEELVDEEHPLLYKPYDYLAYRRFRFSEAGEKAENALKEYCGVGSEEVSA